MAETRQGSRSLGLPQWVGYLSDETLPEKLWALSALQQAQEHARNEEKLGDLIATHSNEDDSDLHRIRDFALGQTVVDLEWLKELAENAAAQKQQASQHVEGTKDELNKRVLRVTESDSHKLAETLREATKEAIRKVDDRSDKLKMFMGDTGHVEALRVSHGAQVDRMGSEEKEKAFSDETVRRINDRETEVCNFIGSTLLGTEHREKVEAVRSMLAKKDELKSMISKAQELIGESNLAMHLENKVLDDDRKRLDRLRDEKDEHLSELTMKRASVTDLLTRLLQESAELSDSEAKHGAVTLKLKQLEEEWVRKTTRSESLTKLHEDALFKLKAWICEAEKGQDVLDEEVQKGMNTAISKDSERLKQVALRKQVALQLCKKAIDQKEKELKKNKSQKYRAELDLDELEKITHKCPTNQEERFRKSEHEQKKKDARDQIKRLTKSIDFCNNKLEGLTGSRDDLEGQWKELLEYEQHSASLGMDDIEQKAVEMVHNAHKDFELFGECLESRKNYEQTQVRASDFIALQAEVHELRGLCLEMVVAQRQSGVDGSAAADEVAKRQKEVDDSAAASEVRASDLIALQAEVHELRGLCREMVVAHRQSGVDGSAAADEVAKRQKEVDDSAAASEVLQLADINRGDEGLGTPHGSVDSEGEVAQQALRDDTGKARNPDEEASIEQNTAQGASQNSSASSSSSGSASPSGQSLEDSWWKVV